ncbi:hypothetical protein BGZ96_010643 [Linnemannia gamsii]|uniref:Uncharacterized protein n=1 Tax=Linnemannia gamsii TaxID=64522 RepID=A0ABQ7JVR0_9FUNG|nr:hypothetical protein BGZ96_010643 [Linnemannia gamsii]
MSESAATVFVIDPGLVDRDSLYLSEIRSELRDIFIRASMDSSYSDVLEARKNLHFQTGKIVLILVTKQDLQVGMSIAELKTALNLPQIGHESGVTWQIQSVSGITGDGLYDAFDWLCVQLNAQKP